MAGTATTTGTVTHRPRGIVRIEVALTTDASGDTTATVIGAAYGKIVRFLYDGGLDASATITIRDYNTGAALISYTTSTEGVAAAFRPTSIITDNAGASIAGHANNPNVNRDINVAGKLTVTVAGGGNAETATIALIIDEAKLSNAKQAE